MTLPKSSGPVLLGLSLCLVALSCGEDEPAKSADTSAGGGPFGSGGSDGSGGSGNTGAGGSATTGGSGGAAGGPAVPEVPELAFASVALPGATNSTDFAFIPGTTDEFLVTAQPGILFHYRFTNSGVAEVGRATIDDTFYLDGCGLLNVLFDPDFEENRFIYLSRCVELEVTRLSRFRLDDIETLASTEAEILTIDEPLVEHPWHRFGSMGFEEDGETLWVLHGDMVVDGLAQDPHHQAGSLLRILPDRTDGGSGYEPADGNAFSGDDGDAAIYAYGLRSPWRGTRDRLGRIWVGDVGDEQAEEVNLVTRAGQNFGWDVHEGPCTEDCEGVTNPITSFGRASDEPYVLQDPLTEPATKRAIWVGQYYDHPTDRYFGLFTNAVMFGDFFTGWVRRLEADEDGTVISDLSVGHLPRITSWKTGNDGYMYALTLDSRLHRATQVVP